MSDEAWFIKGVIFVIALPVLIPLVLIRELWLFFTER